MATMSLSVFDKRIAKKPPIKLHYSLNGSLSKVTQLYTCCCLCEESPSFHRRGSVPISSFLLLGIKPHRWLPHFGMLASAASSNKDIMLDGYLHPSVCVCVHVHSEL